MVFPSKQNEKSASARYYKKHMPQQNILQFIKTCFFVISLLVVGFGLSYTIFYLYYWFVFVDHTTYIIDNAGMCFVRDQVINTVDYQGEDVSFVNNPNSPINLAKLVKIYDRYYSKVNPVYIISNVYVTLCFIVIQSFFTYIVSKTGVARTVSLILGSLSLGAVCDFIFTNIYMSNYCSEFDGLISTGRIPVVFFVRVILMTSLIVYHANKIIKRNNGILLVILFNNAKRFSFIKASKIDDFAFMTPKCSIRALFKKLCTFKWLVGCVRSALSVKKIVMCYLPIVLGIQTFYAVKDVYFRYRNIEIEGLPNGTLVCYIRTQVRNNLLYLTDNPYYEYSTSENQVIIFNDKSYLYDFQVSFHTDIQFMTLGYVSLTLITLLGLGFLPRHLRIQYSSSCSPILMTAWMYICSTWFAFTFMDQKNLGPECRMIRELITPNRFPFMAIFWMHNIALSITCGVKGLTYFIQCTCITVIKGSSIYWYCKSLEKNDSDTAEKYFEIVDDKKNMSITSTEIYNEHLNGFNQETA